jgi:hypothetical protein
MPTTPPPPAAKRTPLQLFDIVAGILLLIVAMLIGFIMLAYITQLGSLSSECDGVDPDGMRCSPGFLSAMGVLGTGIVVFAWFLAAGFLIVRIIRRRIVFFLPIVAVVVMIAGFYLVTALVGSSYLPTSSST